MKLQLLLLGVVVSSSVFSASLVGAWRSDCQELPTNTDGYYSQRPVDTFSADGSATLQIHVYEDRHCKGKEWDLMTIPCQYVLGNVVATLSDTSELDLECTMDGVIEHWYEIVEVKSETVRYGNATGATPEERPHKLGSVIYRRIP